jgi:hypothetical protein
VEVGSRVAISRVAEGVREGDVWGVGEEVPVASRMDAAVPPGRRMIDKATRLTRHNINKTRMIT